MDICGGPVTTVVWPPSFGHHRLATGNLKRGTIDAQALALAFPLIVLQPEHGVSGHESSAGTKSAIAELNRFKGTWEKQFTIYKSQCSPEEETKTGTQTGAWMQTRAWILDDHNLQETGRDSDGMNSMTVYSYDVAVNAYQASAFQSNGNSWQMSG